MTPRFLLAKYAPDLGRMEPRNIGVFLWWNGAIYSKFLGTNEAAFVSEPATYERWLAFWNKDILSGAVTPHRGRPIAIKDPACMDALASTQRGNYILTDAGDLLGDIDDNDIESVVNQIFNDLVAVTTKPESTADAVAAFSAQCAALLQAAGVKYKKRERIPYRAHGVLRHLRPDYYVGNGHPDGIFQRATLSRDDSVNSAAYIVDTLASGNILLPSRCGVLVRSSDIEIANDKDVAREGLELLVKTGRVIDLDDPSAADSVVEVATGE